MKKLLCFLGFHDDEIKEEILHEDKNSMIGNSWFECKRCGRIQYKHGFTHFKAFSIPLNFKE